MCPAYGNFDIKGCGPVPSLDNAKRTLAGQPTEPLLLILAKNVLKKLVTSLLNVKRMKDGLQSWDRAFV